MQVVIPKEVIAEANQMPFRPKKQERMKKGVYLESVYIMLM